MTEQEFRERLRERGYGEPTSKTYAPDVDEPLHTHDGTVMLLVTKGEFRLELEDCTDSFAPGEVCELAAGTLHTEKTGPRGATILVAKK